MNSAQHMLAAALYADAAEAAKGSDAAAELSARAGAAAELSVKELAREMIFARPN